MGFSGGGFSPLHLGTGFAKGGKGEMFGIPTNALKLGSTLSQRWELLCPPALLILEPMAANEGDAATHQTALSRSPK